MVEWFWFWFFINCYWKSEILPNSDGENIEEIVKVEIGGAYLWSPDKTKLVFKIGLKTYIEYYSEYIGWSTGYTKDRFTLFYI